ncbi:MAG: pilus assembly protein, partial [Pseudomonadales bacterium]
LMDAVFSVNSQSGTPLRDALERAGDIYSCTISGRDCPVLPAPDGTCQQNFTLLFSDGYWNGAAGVSGDRDADGIDPWDGGIYADGRADTLADTAMYYYETDLHPTMTNRVVPTAKDRLARVTGTFADEERMHQHMKTFTIAFGIEGSVDPSTVPTVPTGTFTWPDPALSDAAKIDDMLHAAVNGRGEFLSATRPSFLRDAIQDAFDEFSDAQSSTSSASFNSTSLRQGTLLYRGFYDLEDSTGELTATAVDANGVLAATPTWSASDKLQPANTPAASRQLISFDPVNRAGIPFKFANLDPIPQFGLTSNELDWMRGVKTLEVANGGTLRDRETTKMLGDIVHSSPVFAGKPRGFNRDQAPYPTASGKLYSDFVETYKARKEVVWVGANDGMMHAFDAEFGDELYAYLPYQILDDSARYANRARELADPFYAHQYFVDLTPRINDVFMKPTTTAANRSWNTVLVGGLGSGGKGFFALNITDPGTAFSSEANAMQSVLWEFTEEDDTYPLTSAGQPLGGADGAITDPDGLPVKDLGYSMSLPTVAMSNAVNGGDNVWIALFGNGPNSTAGIAKLFVLTLEGGLNGWGDAGDFYKISTDRGVPITEPAELIGFPNGLGSPTAVDEDLNGTVDLVFAGDRLGNLYRFDMRSSDPTQWTAVHLFTAYHDDGGTRLIQPILNRPLVTPHPTKPGFLVTFGTGSYLTDDDASDTSIQSIYGIWDPGTGASSFTAIDDSKDDRLVQQTITNVVDDGVSPAQTRRVHSDNAVNYRAEEVGIPGVYGWYIDLDMQRAATTQSGALNDDTSGNAPPDAQFPGERAVRRFVVRNGNVITTTILPSTGKTSCFGTRPGSILLFDNATGGSANSPTIDFNTDGVIDEDDLVDYNGNLVAGGLLLNQNDLDGSLVDLSTLGGQGDTDFLFVSGGSDTVAYRIDDVEDNRTGRLSWSELQND